MYTSTRININRTVVKESCQSLSTLPVHSTHDMLPVTSIHCIHVPVSCMSHMYVVTVYLEKNIYMYTHTCVYHTGYPGTYINMCGHMYLPVICDACQVV